MIKAFFIAAAITCVLLTACNSSETIKSETTSLDCPQINGVANLLADDGPEIIVVGESHGQNEPPAFVDALICHSLSRGLTTGLALELDYDNGRYENYLNSKGSAADKAAILFDSWMWKGEFTDGRSSEAMLSLLDQARVYQHEGFPLKVITFKTEGLKLEDYPDRAAHSQVYEKRMADNILSGSTDVDKTVVLVGSFHARRDVNKRTGDYELMAAHMPPPQTLTFNTVYSSGTSWNCRGSTPADCGSHESMGLVDPESELGKSQIYTVLYGSDEATIAPFVGRQYGPEFYDGVIYVGKATASPPANIDGRVPYEPEENK